MSQSSGTEILFSSWIKDKDSIYLFVLGINSIIFEAVFPKSMKNIVIVLILSFVWMSSCKELEGVSINDVSAPVELDFDVLALDSIGEKISEVDASTNSDFVNNKSKVQSLEIERITYRVTRIGTSSSDSLILGRFDWLNPQTNAYEELASLNNKKIILDVPYDLALQPSVVNQMKERFLISPYKATIKMKAVMDRKPTDFTISLKVFLKLKVKL